jgi:uncharacterized membrane protein YbhN (UPF0104 family)
VLLSLLGLLLTVGVCAWGLHALDPHQVLVAARRISGWAIAGAVLLRLAMLFAQAARWRVLLPQGSRPALGNLYLYHLVAGAVNWVAPLRPGEAVRVTALARNEGVPWPAAAAAQGVEKVHVV